jgi:HisA/HisF family protein
MHFLPVIDVLDGIVVRAIAGRRSDYKPLTSQLTKSTDTLAVATAIRDRFGWADLYVADLDSITAPRFAPTVPLIDRLSKAGFRIWLDAGIRDAANVEQVANVERLIVGLETLRDLAAWHEIVDRVGPARAVFSLDLRDGQPMNGGSALTISEQVIAAGCRQMIVLDLARVGTCNGTGTEPLCAELLRRHPGLSVYTGGGIRGWDDVRRLESLGVTGVLMASALHDGTFV